MKYTFTHFPTFQKRAIPIAIAGVTAVVLCYHLNLFLYGIGAAILTLGLLLVWQHYCQLKVIVDDRGIRFQRGHNKTAYTWKKIKSVTTFDKGVQIFLAGKSPYPIAIPGTGEGSRHFQTFVSVLKQNCIEHQIECSIK